MTLFLAFGVLKYQNCKFSIFQNFDLRLWPHFSPIFQKAKNKCFFPVLHKILWRIRIWCQICDMRHVWSSFWQNSEKNQVRKKFKILNFFKNFKNSKGAWYGLCMIIKLQVFRFATRGHTPIYPTWVYQFRSREVDHFRFLESSTSNARNWCKNALWRFMLYTFLLTAVRAFRII